MNERLSGEYSEEINRLSLGIEFVDPVRAIGLMHPVRVDIERRIPHSMKKPKDPYCRFQSPGRLATSFCRHPSGRYALIFQPGTGSHIDIRIYDHWRYYVPRRLRVPLMSREQIEKPENSFHFMRRRRLVLFPGAAYDLAGKATGLRGRVLRNGKPMRWAYVEAVLPGTDSVVGRARGDDSGEFLLLLSSGAAVEDTLTRIIKAEVSVAGPVEPPVPDRKDIPGLDNLWDLPLEVLPVDQPGEDISSGESFPDGYAIALSSERIVDFEIGRILTGIDEASFEFVLP